MDNALKDLESSLETLTPRGLSDVGRDELSPADRSVSGSK